jgi:fatty acid desaturase
MKVFNPPQLARSCWQQGCQIVCFQNKNPSFGNFFFWGGDLAMENLGIFYDQLVYFTAIVNILGAFGIFCGHLVYFSPIWYFVPWEIWQPWLAGRFVAKLSLSRV